jgi:hypothetical protein
MATRQIHTRQNATHPGLTTKSEAQKTLYFDLESPDDLEKNRSVHAIVYVSPSDEVRDADNHDLRLRRLRRTGNCSQERKKYRRTQ